MKCYLNLCEIQAVDRNFYLGNFMRIHLLAYNIVTSNFYYYLDKHEVHACEKNSLVYEKTLNSQEKNN